MKRAKDATLVISLFVVYCVLLSQGLSPAPQAPSLARLQHYPSPFTFIAGCGHYRQRTTAVNVARTRASGEMLLKQRARRAGLMGVSGIPTRTRAGYLDPRVATQTKPRHNRRDSCRNTT